MLMHCPQCHSRHVRPAESSASARSDPVFSHLSLQHIIQCAALGAKLGKRLAPRHPIAGTVTGAVVGGLIGGLTTVATLPVNLPFMHPNQYRFECLDCGCQFDPLQQGAMA